MGDSLPEVLVAEHVAKRHAVGRDVVVALEDASITLLAGQFACLTGASGSGKSTFLTILAGIEKPDRGVVSLLGANLSACSDRARAQRRLQHVGVVFQGHNLVPELTARENVALPLLARGFERADVWARVNDSLAAVDVDDLADRFPHALSGGQRQRVGIARALAGGQEVLLADEPTGALDAVNAVALYKLLGRLCRDARLAVLVATHDPSALKFADREVRIAEGVTTT